MLNGTLQNKALKTSTGGAKNKGLWVLGHSSRVNLAWPSVGLADH